MIKYKDAQGKSTRNVNPENLSEFIEYTLNGEFTDKKGAKDNFKHFSNDYKAKDLIFGEEKFTPSERVK